MENDNFEKFKEQVLLYAKHEKPELYVDGSTFLMALFYKRLCDLQIKTIMEKEGKSLLPTLDESYQAYRLIMKKKKKKKDVFLLDTLGYYLPKPFTLFKTACGEDITLNYKDYIVFKNFKLELDYELWFGDVEEDKIIREDYLFFLGDKLSFIEKANFNEFDDNALGDLFEEVISIYLKSGNDGCAYLDYIKKVKLDSVDAIKKYMKKSVRSKKPGERLLSCMYYCMYGVAPKDRNSKRE